jgi:hypothetical protein
MKGGWRHDGRHCSAKRERVAWSQVEAAFARPDQQG